MMAAGNVAFARPSDSTPLVGLAVEELFKKLDSIVVNIKTYFQVLNN